MDRACKHVEIDDKFFKKLSGKRGETNCET
jgi:hypothetical protein